MLVRAPDATHVYAGMDLARLERRAQAVGGGDRCRSRQDRHPRSRILRRRSVLSGRQDAALSGPAGGAADLRDVRCLRSGAARVARRDLREVRRGDRAGRDAGLWRLSLHARGRRRRRTRPMSIRRSRQAGSARDASRTSPLPIWSPLAEEAGRPTPRPRPMASRSAPNSRPKIRPAGAGSRVRDAIGRSDVSRAGRRPRLVRQDSAKASNSCSACSRPTRPRSRSRICSAKPARPSSRRASTPSSPMSAAASAGATTRRSRSMSRWRRCSFPAVRSGWRMTATSSSRRGIKRHAFKMRSRIGVDRATGKIQAFAADHVLDGGGLANFSRQRGHRRRDRRDRHLRCPEGRRDHGRAAFARRDRGIDARLRHAADDDRAGSAGR